MPCFAMALKSRYSGSTISKLDIFQEGENENISHIVGAKEDKKYFSQASLLVCRLENVS